MDAVITRPTELRYPHRHADGGLYAPLAYVQLKHPHTGEWFDAVVYYPLPPEPVRLFTTTLERWTARFTPVPQPQDVEPTPRLRFELPPACRPRPSPVGRWPPTSTRASRSVARTPRSRPSTTCCSAPDRPRRFTSAPPTPTLRPAIAA